MKQLKSQWFYQLYHIGCRHCSVGNIQSNCNKRTVFSHSVWLCSVQYCCAVSCVKLCSAQTVHRPTAAVPSRFWHHWIHSTPKLYTATGTEIALGLGVESYTETGKGARFGFWNMCVHLNQLTILSVCLETILLDRGWPQRGWSKWSKKVNIQLL